MPFMNEILRSDEREIPEKQRPKRKIWDSIQYRPTKSQEVVDLIRRFQKGTQGSVGRR